MLFMRMISICELDSHVKCNIALWLAWGETCSCVVQKHNMACEIDAFITRWAGKKTTLRQKKKNPESMQRISDGLHMSKYEHEKCSFLCITFSTWEKIQFNILIWYRDFLFFVIYCACWLFYPISRGISLLVCICKLAQLVQIFACLICMAVQKCEVIFINSFLLTRNYLYFLGSNSRKLLFLNI